MAIQLSFEDLSRPASDATSSVTGRPPSAYDRLRRRARRPAVAAGPPPATGQLALFDHEAASIDTRSTSTRSHW